MLIGLLSAVVAVVTVVLAAAVLFFSMQCILGLWPTPQQERKAAPLRSTAILIPAHNEEQTIERALNSVLGQMEHNDRLVVIADNCTDGTAEKARHHGAEVVVRSNSHKLGKAYALDAGIRYLANNPPDVVIVLDADCVAAPGAKAHLMKEVIWSGRPVQACYLMKAPHPATPPMAARELAFLIKNRIRLRGLSRLGLPSHLTGSGMAFPWSVIASADFSDAHLVEDMKLGLELAGAGQGAVFCDQALVTSSFPSSERGLQTQADRWEKGRLLLAASCAETMIAGIRHARPGALLLALDALIPPITLLVGLAMLQALAAIVLALSGGIMCPLTVAIGNLVALTAVATCLWLSHRHVITLSQLHALPLLALSKLKSYPRMLKTRSLEWIRTDRSLGGA